VGLFFYAATHSGLRGKLSYSHGAKIKKESDIKYRAIEPAHPGRNGNAGNDMNIVILDACRDNPFSRSFRSAARALASSRRAARHLYYLFHQPGNVAADGKGRNSPYTESLLKHISTPACPLSMSLNGASDLAAKPTAADTMELSSLSGDFYFRTAPAKQGND